MSYEDETARELAARELADKRATFGTEVLTFDQREWRRWLEFKEQAGGLDPFVILAEWKQAKAGAPAQVVEAVAVHDAVAKYFEFRHREKLSPDTVRHIKKHVVDRFGARFAGKQVREITADQLEAWLDSLVSSKGPLKGKPVDPLTRRHHRKDVNTFFDFCWRKQWIDRNPCELVAVPQVQEEDVQLLTVEEGRRLFKENADQPVVARLALEAFGFLRASSAGRLKKEHVNFAERGIRMPGAEHKSGKTKFRQGHPDNLWAWLARATDETWAMSWWEYRNEKGKAFARAKIDGGSENRLRRTCLSAHLAWQKNQPLTSYLAQHRHTSTTDIYLGVMTEADGKRWFEIQP